MSSTSLYSRPPPLSDKAFADCVRWAEAMDRAVCFNDAPPMEEPPLHYSLYRQYNPAAIEPLRAKTLQQNRREILDLRELRTLQGGKPITESESMPLRGFELFMRTLERVQLSADRNLRTNMQSTVRAMQVANRAAPARAVQRDNRRDSLANGRYAGGRGDSYRPRYNTTRDDRQERFSRRDRTERARTSQQVRFFERSSDRPRSPSRPRAPARARSPVRSRHLSRPPAPPPTVVEPRPGTPFPRPVPLIYDYEDHDQEMRDATPVAEQFGPLPANDAAPNAPPFAFLATALGAAATVALPPASALATPAASTTSVAAQALSAEPTPGESVQAPEAAGQQLPLAPPTAPAQPRVDEVFVYQPLAVMTAIPPPTRITPTGFDDDGFPSDLPPLIPDSPMSDPDLIPHSDYANGISETFQELDLGAMNMAVDEYMSVEPALPFLFQ